jgi:hypothetical protein
MKHLQETGFVYFLLCPSIFLSARSIVLTLAQS